VPRHRARLRDWIFGAAGKRRLLEALLADPRRAWTQTELARAAALETKGSVDEHLSALIQLGVVTERSARYRLTTKHPLVAPLRGLLQAIAQIPDTPLKRPGE
jgi:hypothetical protein